MNQRFDQGRLDRECYGHRPDVDDNSQLVSLGASGDRGVIVLQGKVPSYYLKQMAQDTVMAVPGVEVLLNELQIEGGNR